MAVGSLRFATGLIEKYYSIPSQNMYKVISSYSFFKQEPYRKQLNNNHTNGPECACINVISLHKKINVIKKNHSNYKDSQFESAIY